MRISDWSSDVCSSDLMSMGERKPLAMINAPASGRMAVAEALTNLVASDVQSLKDIKLSANWIAACGVAGPDAALYDNVSAVSQWRKQLDLSIDRKSTRLNSSN